MKILARALAVLAGLLTLSQVVGAPAYGSIYATPSTIICASDAVCASISNAQVLSVTYLGVNGSALYAWDDTTSCTPDGVFEVRPAGATHCFWMKGFSPKAQPGLIFVGDGAGGPSELGANLAAAYAAAPIAGGQTFFVVPSFSGNGYTMTTQFVEGTVDKCIPIMGAGVGSQNFRGTTINWAATSGNGPFKFDCVSNNGAGRSEFVPLSNLSLTNNGCNSTGGCGSTVAAVEIGSVNDGDLGATYQNLTIQGFGTFFKNHNQYAVNETLQNVNVYSAGVVLELGTTVGSIGQQIRVIGGIQAANGKVLYIPAAYTVGPEVTYSGGTSLFDNVGDPVSDCAGATEATPCLIKDFGVHRETSPTAANAHLFGGCFGMYAGGDIWEDDNLGTTTTATISIASPAVVTMTNTFAAGQILKFATTGALPTGITAGSLYYVIAAGLSGSQLEFSATPGGAAVNTSGSQSGVQSVVAGVDWMALASCNRTSIVTDGVDVVANRPLAAILSIPNLTEGSATFHVLSSSNVGSIRNGANFASIEDHSFPNFGGTAYPQNFRGPASFQDVVTSPNGFVGNVTGSATTATNAANVTTSASTANATFFPVLAPSSSSGNQALVTSSMFSFNPSTGALGNNGTITSSTADQTTARVIVQNTASGGHAFALVAGVNGVSNSGVSLHDTTANLDDFVFDNSGNLSLGAYATPGYLVVGAGGLVTSTPALSGTSTSIGGGALIAGACASTTVTISGATNAMVADVSPITYPGDGFYWRGYVSSSNTVTASVCAAVSGTPAASTYNIRVLR